METPVLGTITGIQQYDVSMQNEPPKMKWGITFAEVNPPLNKPLILNATRMGVLEAMTGSDSSDDWMGKKIVVWQDKTVVFGSKVTGGTALRAPKNQQHIPVDPPQEQPEDEIPF